MSLKTRVFLGAAGMLLLVLAGFWFGIRPMVTQSMVEERMTIVSQMHANFLDRNDRFFDESVRTAGQLKNWLSAGPEPYNNAFSFSVSLNPLLITQEIYVPGLPVPVSARNLAYQGVIPDMPGLEFTGVDSVLSYSWARPEKDLELFILRQTGTANDTRVTVYTCFDASDIISQLRAYNLGADYALVLLNEVSVIYSTHHPAVLPAESGTGEGETIRPVETDSGRVYQVTGKFRTLPLTLSISLPESGITGPVDRLFLIVIGILTGLSAVFFAGFQFYYLAVTRPVRDLVAGIRPLQNLRFSEPVPMVNIPELKPVSEALETMRSILDEYDRMRTRKLLLAESRNQFMINYIEDFLAIANETGEFHFLNQKMEDLLNHHNLLNPTYSMTEMVGLLTGNHIKKPVNVEHEDEEYNISVLQGESKIATGNENESLICKYQFVQIREKISDKMLGSLLILHDMTEDRVLEDLKKDMMNIMVHELRNPITSIIGFSDILLDDGGLNEENTKFVSIIRSSGDKLSRLINRFLDVQRLESGKMEINFSPVNIKTVVEDLVMTFLPQLEDKELKVNFSAANQIPEIEASNELISEAIQNLLSNAIKYGDPGRTIEIKLLSQPGFVTFSITDYGYGIPASEQSRLFTKFFRVKSNEKAYKQVGTGLGLAYVKEIISRHQGNITLESAKEYGCRFTVTLPVKQGVSGD